jgi:hypothetical protein
MSVYTNEDYNSGDGMLTSVWGPGLWHYLHTMSFNYPIHPSKENKKYYKEFILLLKHVLPCKHCRTNLVKNFKELPLLDIHMKSRNTFSKYVYDLHEHINKMLGKISNLSFEDVRERYEHFRARCSKKITKKEKGCTESLYGEKAKCIIKIVPNKYKCKTFQMNKSCKKKRLRKSAKIV